MKIKLSDEFYYCIKNKQVELKSAFNSSKENIIRNNEKIPQYEGEWVRIKVNKYRTHFVKPAETLNDIAKIYSISEQKIIEDNLLKDRKLFLGQMLKIFN